MTIVRNNCNGGPNGTTITAANSGQGGDDAWYTTNHYTSSGGVLRFTSADGMDRPTAEFVMEASSGATSVGPKAFWYTSFGSHAEFWMRCYARYDAIPDTLQASAFFNAMYGGGAGDCSYIGVNTTGHPYVARGNFLSTTTCTATVMTGEWFRTEAHYQISTTVGLAELRFYGEPDADIDDYTEQVSMSNVNLGAAASDLWSFGHSRANTNLGAIFLSGMVLSDEGWVGPAPFRPGKGVPGVLSTPVAIHNDCR